MPFRGHLLDVDRFGSWRNHRHGAARHTRGQPPPRAPLVLSELPCPKPSLPVDPTEIGAFVPLTVKSAVRRKNRGLLRPPILSRQRLYQHPPYLVIRARQDLDAEDIPPVAGSELQVSLAGGGVEEADRGVVRPGGEARAGVVPAQTVHAACVCAGRVSVSRLREIQRCSGEKRGRELGGDRRNRQVGRQADRPDDKQTERHAGRRENRKAYCTVVPTRVPRQSGGVPQPLDHRRVLPDVPPKAEPRGPTHSTAAGVPLLLPAPEAPQAGGRGCPGAGLPAQDSAARGGRDRSFPPPAQQLRYILRSARRR